MPLRAWECFAAFSALRAQKKPLPAKDRGADDKGSECRRAQKSLPRIAGDIAFPRRNKGNRLKCGAGRTLPGNEPEGRVTKKGYNRICFRVHLYALICSCNLLKSKTGRRMTASFHAVDRGSNPLGDANEIMPLREIVRAFFVLRHFQKMSVHPSGYSAAIPTTLSQTYYSGRRVIRHHEHGGTPYPCRALAF